MSYQKGVSPALERRRERTRLAPHAPLIELTLTKLNIDIPNIDEVRIWGNRLLRSRDQWADENRGGRRYSDAALAQALVRTVNRKGGDR